MLFNFFSSSIQTFFLERNTRLFLCYIENQTNLQSKLGHSPTFPHCLWKCLNYSSLISLFSQTLFECSKNFWSNLESNKEIQLSILITRYLTSCKLTKKYFLQYFGNMKKFNRTDFSKVLFSVFLLKWRQRKNLYQSFWRILLSRTLIGYCKESGVLKQPISERHFQPD